MDSVNLWRGMKRLLLLLNMLTRVVKEHQQEMCKDETQQENRHSIHKHFLERKKNPYIKENLI